MAVDVSFDLFARADDCKELNRVFEPDVTTDSRVMVNQDQGGFVGVGVEGFGQPIQLFLPEQAGRCLDSMSGGGRLSSTAARREAVIRYDSSSRASPHGPAEPLS